MTLRRPLTIRNATRWSTPDLRRILAAGLAAHGLTHCTVHVGYRRANSNILGRATIGRRGCRTGAAQTMWLHLERIAPTDSKLVQMFPDKAGAIIAQTIDHEIYHLRGLRHRQFPKHVLANDAADKPPPWWTDDLRLAWRPAAAPKPKPSVEAKRAAKLAHAQAMLKKAETRAKRAETIRTKWQRAVSRIVREIARGENVVTEVNADAALPVSPAVPVETIAAQAIAARRQETDHA